MTAALSLGDIEHALRAAVERARIRGDAWVRVELDVPSEAEFVWNDEYGSPRSVHLPTRAVFESIHDEPDETVAADDHLVVLFPARIGTPLDNGGGPRVAGQILMTAIRWGGEVYGTGQPHSWADPLPQDLRPLVIEALT
jgi:hypothetical protein